MRRFLSITGIVLILLFEAHAQTLIVTHIVDGDTIDLSDGRRIRLIGIDTPEKYASSKLERDVERSGLDRETVKALGELASIHLEELVLGRSVLIEYDQANAATNYLDRYERTLAYVFVIDEAGEKVFMINEQMIVDGYAKAYTSFPFTYPEKFLELQREAIENQRGLWADDAMEKLQ